MRAQSKFAGIILFSAGLSACQLQVSGQEAAITSNAAFTLYPAQLSPLPNDADMGEILARNLNFHFNKDTNTLGTLGNELAFGVVFAEQGISQMRADFTPYEKSYNGEIITIESEYLCPVNGTIFFGYDAQHNDVSFSENCQGEQGEVQFVGREYDEANDIRYSVFSLISHNGDVQSSVQRFIDYSANPVGEQYYLIKHGQHAFYVQHSATEQDEDNRFTFVAQNGEFSFEQAPATLHSQYNNSLCSDFYFQTTANVKTNLLTEQAVQIPMRSLCLSYPDVTFTGNMPQTSDDSAARYFEITMSESGNLQLSVAAQLIFASLNENDHIAYELALSNEQGEIVSSSSRLFLSNQDSDNFDATYESFNLQAGKYLLTISLEPSSVQGAQVHSNIRFELAGQVEELL